MPHALVAKKKSTDHNLKKELNLKKKNASFPEMYLEYRISSEGNLN